MILAAGFGTRLLPYTEQRPKPLFPLLNRELLLLHIDGLKRLGCERIIVNCHYLREQIVAALQGIDGVIVQQETTILGTGGGLRQALQYMSDEPLLIINGDIYHTIDLQALYNNHLADGRPVTLAVHDYPRFNTIGMKNGRITGFAGQADEGGEKLAFTGVHVVDPAILQVIMPGVQSCIIERYRKLVCEDAGQFNLVRVDTTDDLFWCDMGTPADYLALHGDLLQGRAPLIEGLTCRATGPFLTSDKTNLPDDLLLDEWACIGKAKIGRNVTVRRSVIWDGAVIGDNAVVEDTIVTA